METEAEPTTENEQGALTTTVTEDEVIDRIVRDLTTLQRRAGLEMARAVGRLIIDGLYGGDLAGWRTRGVKDSSFRKLSARGDLPMRPGSIYQAVAIFELTERLGLKGLQNLGISHLRLVLGLPERQQVRLIERAEANGVSVSHLEAEVRKLRREVPGAGRPALPRFRRTLNAVTRALADDDEDDALGDLDRIAELDDNTVAEIQAALRLVRQKMDALEAALSRRTAPPTDAGVADV